MDQFVDALLGDSSTAYIPPQDDWYAPLLGDWDFDFSDAGGRRLNCEVFARRK